MTDDANPICVIVNGEEQVVPAGTTVQQLLEQLRVPLATTAVELGGAILPHSRYPDTPLQSGQVMEVVRFVGGG